MPPETGFDGINPRLGPRVSTAPKAPSEARERLTPVVTRRHSSPSNPSFRSPKVRRPIEGRTCLQPDHLGQPGRPRSRLQGAAVTQSGVCYQSPTFGAGARWKSACRALRDCHELCKLGSKACQTCTARVGKPTRATNFQDDSGAFTRLS